MLCFARNPKSSPGPQGLARFEDGFDFGAELGYDLGCDLGVEQPGLGAGSICPNPQTQAAFTLLQQRLREISHVLPVSSRLNSALLLQTPADMEDVSVSLDFDTLREEAACTCI